MKIKYPEIKVKLTNGPDGNAFAILAICSQAMKDANLDEHEQDDFMASAMAGDYDHLLATTMRWFDVS